MSREGHEEWGVDMLVGQNIRKFRELAGMSREELAKLSGLNLRELREYEEGKKGPPIGILLSFANALKIDSIEFLLGESPLKIPRPANNNRPESQ